MPRVTSSVRRWRRASGRIPCASRQPHGLPSIKKTPRSRSMLHAKPARRFLAPLVAFVASMSISITAASADNPRERAAMLASQAEKILNSYAGRRETLAQAQKLIHEALALDPASGHALVEQGRAILMSDP